MTHEGIRGEGVLFSDLQAVLDAYEDAPYLSVIVDSSPEFRVLAANRSARAVMGDRDLLGRAAAEVMPDLDGQGIWDHYRRVAASGQAATLVEFPAHFRNPDGSETVMWVDFTLTPCRVDGRVVAYVSRTWDVTERVEARHRMEAELRSAEASLMEARQVVDTLQRALLPDRVPLLPGMAVAAAYLLAAAEQAAGGDSFDAVPRDGKVVLVVGDVVGHGVGASAAMGQLRAVLLDHIGAGESICDVVLAGDRWARRHRASFGSTVALVEVDPTDGSFTYLTAGHPPPLVVSDAGEACGFLDPSGHGPLGDLDAVHARTGSLAADEVLVLYSDGLVELPGTTPMQGTVTLARAAREAAANLLFPIGAPTLTTERVARHTLEHLARLRGCADDATILVAQRGTSAPRLEVDVAVGEPGAVTRCRTALLRWLESLHVHKDELDAVLHAVGELVQNVVDHAYPDIAGGPVRLRVAVEEDGTAVVIVADDGTTATPPTGADPGRGLGLAMARTLLDDVRIDSTAAGTTVTVRHRLHRAAGHVSLVDMPAPVPERVTSDVWSHLLENGVEIGASGPLDAAAAAELTATVAISAPPDGSPVTLNLREVTLLGSAAVHAILRARTQLPGLRIIAPPGSVAQHVLTLVAIPFVTE